MHLRSDLLSRLSLRPTAAAVLLAVSALALGLAACGGHSSTASGGGGSTNPGDQEVADAGGTITVAIPQDPGSLDPQHTVTSAAGQLVAFAYDSLVYVDEKGQIQPGLATKWTQSGNTYTFEIKPGVTCSSGAPMTPSLIARNLNYLTDPANGYGLLGVYLPEGLSAKGDDAAGTVKVTTKGPFAFFLNGLAAVPIVCKAGLADHDSLKQKTDGSGPYVLSEAVANDHYTYSVRKGYDWGPGGATTAERGMPATVTFKVVSEETTAANLLLSGQINVAAVAGPDRERLSTSDLFKVDIHNVDGEIYYNETAGKPTAEEPVRRALTMALDLPEVGSVLTGGTGTPAEGMVTLEPTACHYDAVAANLPEHDLAGAEALLDEAGWKVGADGIREKDGKQLAISFLYGTTQPIASAAELAAEQWGELGVKVNSESKTDTEISSILFETGSWDVTWNTLQVQFPSQLVPFLSGATPADGTNFAHLKNPSYEKLAATASAKQDASGCDDWQAAEEALFKAVDVVPYYNQVYPTWGNGVTFANTASGLVPTSLRVLAG